MKRVLVALALVVVLLGAFAAFLVQRNLPDRSVPRIPGLTGPVSVSFDDRGVALVKAGSLGDALRVQGFLTARERLFQLELQRRVASGELSEIFGPATLEVDRIHRIYGFSRVAAAAVPLLPAAERESLEALSDGLNSFIDSHPGRLGLEFTLLRITPRRFTPADSLLVLLLMYEDLTTTWRAEASAETLAALPEGVRRFLTSRATPDDVSLVPDAIPVTRAPLPDLTNAVFPSHPLRFLSFESIEGLGSNNWAVSGALTKSGRPILANDPHLGLNMPSIWLPMRLAIGEQHIEGVTLPGMPGIVLGKNDGMAWAFTNVGTDIQDLYRETIVDGKALRNGRPAEKVRSRVESIWIRGREAERLTVLETSHGPFVQGDLALTWTALDPKNLRLPIASIMLASDRDAFDKAFDAFLGPGQNVVWASKAGAIGWRPTGVVPIRRAGTDGSVPYDGRDPENDWKGLLLPADLPRVVDPPSGYIVTANQRIIGNRWPHPVATDWPSPGRARRIRDLLEIAKRDGRKLDRAGIEAIQLDTHSDSMRLLSEPFLPFLPPDLAASLKSWNGNAASDSASYLVASALRRKLRERALTAWHVEKWNSTISEDLTTELARAAADAFPRAGLGSRDAFLRGTADAAIAELSNRFGKDRARWSWGEANRLQVRHPLGRIPGLGWLFNPPSIKQAGASAVVKASSPAYGQSMRFIVDWGASEAATLVVPFGVSGHVGSPHRFDQLPFWSAGDPSGEATRLARPAVGTPLEFRP